MMNSEKIKLVISVARQEADLFRGHQKIATYRVSTAKSGVGCELNSLKTPPGVLRVARKIGADAARGTIFRARVNTGEIWDPSAATEEEDLVLSRILWLEGTTEQNQNTLDRFVYLHGTNSEHLLGIPASHGCIRFSNEHIIEVFEHLAEGSLVEVVA